MKKLLAACFILLFSFCSQKEKSPYPRLLVSEQDEVIQVNTKEMLGVRPNRFGFNFTQDTDEKSHAFEGYEKLTDANKSKKHLIFGGWVVNENYVPYSSVIHDTVIPRMDLKVIVDTTYTINRNHFQYKNYYYPINQNGKGYNSDDKSWKLYHNIIEKLEKQYVDCYPVLIYNNSKDNCLMGAQMIQEAKDSDGNWKPIEFVKRGHPGCTPSPIPVLFSKKYWGSYIIKYEGDFKTKLRVKYVNQWNVYYSNEFTGYINKSQFDKKPYFQYFKRNLADSYFWMSLEERQAFDFLDYQQYKKTFSVDP